MFTGIVTDVGEVLGIEPRGEGLRRLIIGCRYDRDTIADGASIACSGVCLSVTGAGVDGRTWFTADAAAETLRVTTVGGWQTGTRINLERSLKIGDELGGHLVAGHVDGIAEVLTREELTDSARFTFRAPAALARFIASKGSVALDGISLTVNEVEGSDFGVNLIPHTKEVTTFGTLREGQAVNLEVDTMARYVARLREM
jgi:riboflavin synthase